MNESNDEKKSSIRTDINIMKMSSACNSSIFIWLWMILMLKEHLYQDLSLLNVVKLTEEIMGQLCLCFIWQGKTPLHSKLMRSSINSTCITIQHVILFSSLTDYHYLNWQINRHCINYRKRLNNECWRSGEKHDTTVLF